MDKGRKNIWRQLVGLLFNILLAAVPALIFNYTYMHYYEEATFWQKGNYLFMVLYIFVLVLFMLLYGGFNIRRYRTRELVFSFVLASLITNFIMYLVMSLIARKALTPTHVCVAMLVQWVVELLFYIAFRIADPLVNPNIQTVYVSGPGDVHRTTWKKFDARRTRYTIAETVDESLPIEQLLEVFERYDAVAAGEIDENLRRDIMAYCFRKDKPFLMLPSMTDVMINSAEKLIMGDTLMYAPNMEGFAPGYRIAKRGLDILVALLGLIILSPLLLITALCIKLYDGGPVFYKQVRLTRGGRRFEVLKFRSMIVNAESSTGAVLAGKTDSRITPIGKIIRATRIDELPQLWNILRGDMTLVGPRPERPEFYEKYCAEYPEFAYRLKVTAGLTGYAQLYGKYNTSFEDKARLDMYYIQRATFLRDLQLLFYTLKIIFIRESTEGVDSGGEKETRQQDGAAVH